MKFGLTYHIDVLFWRIWLLSNTKWVIQFMSKKKNILGMIMIVPFAY